MTTHDNATDEPHRSELTLWRQGDIATPGRFAWQVLADHPPHDDPTLTEPSRVEVAWEDIDHGLVVITPTCDFFPREGRRPGDVTLAPVVALEGSLAEDARHRRRPRYAFLCEREGELLFADLDRVCTAEGSVLEGMLRVPVLDRALERRVFSDAIARKFGRFSFPDALRDSLVKWRTRLRDRHGRFASTEGDVYRKIVEVRAEAVPSWDSGQIEVTIHLIAEPGWLPESDPDVSPTVRAVEAVSQLNAAEAAEALFDGDRDSSERLLLLARLEVLWADMCEVRPPIASIEFRFVAEDEMTVAHYKRTESLDLDFISPVDDRSP